MMSFNIVSFLLVFTQLFYSGGDRTRLAKNDQSAFITTTQDYSFRNNQFIESFQQLIYIETACDDDSEDQILSIEASASVHYFSSLLSVTTPLNKTFYLARSNIDDTPLFLLYRSFRV